MKILVVDDEAALRDVCSQALSRAGYDVSTVASGEEAVPRLVEGWDIILTDLSMPGAIDGNELVRRARAIGHADVLLMTGNPALETAIQAMKDGAFDYLIKPFSVDTLRIAVKRCEDKRRLSQELAREKALRAELARMQKVEETFGQFVTPEVAEFVLAHPDDFWNRAERRAVTILFSDVRGFSSFAARVPPEEVVSALNDIFVRVIDAIRWEGGILNKFIGDGLMALFGAPIPSERHAQAAARAAVRARDAVEALAGARSKQGLVPLRIGTGVNTGEVVAGCVGTKDRAEYSVIGHAVNLAARLEEAAAPGQILVGPDTHARIRETFEISGTLTLKLAGMPEPVPVTELIGERRPDGRPVFGSRAVG